MSSSRNFGLEPLLGCPLSAQLIQGELLSRGEIAVEVKMILLASIACKFRLGGFRCLIGAVSTLRLVSPSSSLVRNFS